MDLNAKHILVDVEYERIGEIDNTNERYFAEVTFSFTWDLDKPVSEYDPNKNWNPNIGIENLFVKPEIKTEYILSNNGRTVTEKRNLKVNYFEQSQVLYQ